MTAQTPKSEGQAAPFVRPLTPESLGTARGRGRLAQRHILVVGGGQRIHDAATDPVGNGRAMSLLFAREGAKVAVADVNVESADATVTAILNEGGSATAIRADVTRETDVRRMIEKTVQALGTIDGIVLNVGTFGRTGIDDCTPEEWNAVFDVNVRGPMLCARESLKHLADGSAIVFISSIAALKAGSQMASYDASKAALGGLMRNVAQLGARRGIRANLVYPGLVDTPNGRAASAGRPSRGATRIPFGRQATAWEIAYAVLFFVSDESAYLTGQTLAVDGGLTGF